MHTDTNIDWLLPAQPQPWPGITLQPRLRALDRESNQRLFGLKAYALALTAEPKTSQGRKDSIFSVTFSVLR